MTSREDLVRRFSNARIVVIGDVMLDEYVSGPCSRLSAEAPVPVVGVSSTRGVLGGAGNTAANVASLGGHAILICPIGPDEAGRQIADLAAARSIRLSAVPDRRQTTRKTRVLGSRQQLVRLDYEDTSAIGLDVVDSALQAIDRHIGDCDVVVVSDYAKGFVTAAIAEHIMRAARRAKVPVVVDPRPQHGAFYDGCDYLTPNWKEAQALIGEVERPATADTVEETGRRLVTRFGSNVLLTLGAQGMMLFPRDGGEVISEPAQAREVFDVSGAGDTVVAALSLAVAAGADARSAVRLANLAAGVVVGKLGTATVSPDEIMRGPAAEGRLVGRAELGPLARRVRAEGKRLVTINGSFDLLHAGHLHILREARRQGDVLIVGLNSDGSVRSQKGPDRPFVKEEDRTQMLLALRDVDYVHVFDEPVPMPFLEEIRPDVHVNGSEYGEQCIEGDTVRRHGGRIHIVGRLPGLSTSELAARLRRAADAAKT